MNAPIPASETASPDPAGASPVMAQFFYAKARQPDALIFFRMGDFYELFFEDAVKAAAAICIAQTFRGVHAGTVVGKQGLERTYDRYLRGVDGVRRVQVDAFGRPIANYHLRDVAPVAGQRLRLSLDVGLTRTGDEAMHGQLNAGGHPGAFVALDPRSGEILAMGSNPTFDPELLTRPITQKRLRSRSERSGVPYCSCKWRRAKSSAASTIASAR